MQCTLCYLLSSTNIVYFLDNNLYALKLHAVYFMLLVKFDELFFQQDGAPPHFVLSVRDYLNEVFPQRWFGKRGSIEWPPCSPDLTPMDFFF